MEGASNIMKAIIMTRLIHWKKQWHTLLFWLLFPVICTMIILLFVDVAKDSTKVPVGIVLEENTPSALDLLHKIEQTPIIRAVSLTEKEALYQLTKHEIDSVFVIHKGYEEKVHKHDRHQLISSYFTELSFTYPTMKEIIISFVQQDTGRSKAAQVVQSLAKQYNEEGRWSTEDIVIESKLTEADQDLLQTTFSFYKNDKTDEKDENISLVKGWNIWAILALLATFLLFDWTSKEVHSKTRSRFHFTRTGLKQYLLFNLFIYIFMFIIIDLLTIIIFHYFLNDEMTLKQYGAIFSYRLMISLGSFLLSTCFKRVYSYYLVAFVISLLLAIGSGAFLPLDGLLKHFHFFKWLNPLYAFTTNNSSFQWLTIFIIITIFWYIRKERPHATS